MVGETGGKRDQWHFWRRLMAGTNCGDQWRGPGERTSGSSAWIIGVSQTRWPRCPKAPRSPRSAARRKMGGCPPLRHFIFSQVRSFRRQGGGPATSTGTFPALLAELALQFEITIAPAASPAPRTERTPQRGRPSQKRTFSNRLAFEIVPDQK